MTGPTVATETDITDSGHADRRHDGSRRTRLRPWALAAIAYIACSFWMTRHVWRHPTTRWIGVPGDPQAFMWWLDWVPFAIRHGLNPLHPTIVQYPLGVNAMWNTSILVPGLIMAPVTWAFGPILSWNLIHAGAPVASALLAMLAIDRFVDRRFPAFVGGLVYGFSPYMTLKVLVHTNLVITVLPPLLLLCLHELFVRRRRSPVVVGVVLGLAIVGQLLTSEEILLIAAIACALTCAALALVERRLPDAGWRDGLRGLGVAAGVATIVGTPFVLYQFFGPRSAQCCVSGLSKYVLDAQTLFAPSPFQFFHTAGAMQMSRQWQGLDESSGYVGIPLLVVLVVTIVALRRRRAIQVSAIVLVVLIVFSFGGEVEFAGKGTGIPGPWRVLHHLPLFANVVVGRFMMVAYLAIGMIVAIALDVLIARRPTVRTRLLIGGILVAVLTLAPPTARVTDDHTPAFFRDETAMDRLLPSDAVVLASPYFESDAMLWQATSGNRFSLIEGNVFIPGPEGTPVHNGPLIGIALRINQLSPGVDGVRTTITPEERRTYLGELDDHGVNTILVGPSPGQPKVVRFIADLLGSPGTTSGGVTVFRVAH